MTTQACTGLVATWCPVHGDCTCPRTDGVPSLEGADCPLHRLTSAHAEGAEGDDPNDLAVARDAERWRKLVACQRIRVLGHAYLGDPDAHLGLELWGVHPGKHPDGAAVLTAFVDGLKQP